MQQRKELESGKFGKWPFQKKQRELEMSIQNSSCGTIIIDDDANNVVVFFRLVSRHHARQCPFLPIPSSVFTSCHMTHVRVVLLGAGLVELMPEILDLVCLGCRRHGALGANAGDRAGSGGSHHCCC